MKKDLSNRDILIRAASTLFREKGYDGTGLNEILAASGLPKGSLYYHFPGGKRELAEAATERMSDTVSSLFDNSFSDAESFPQGAVATCRTVAEILGKRSPILGCPVNSILQAGPNEPKLREVALAALQRWRDLLAGHARRLGSNEPERAADLLLMQLEGAWMMSLAEQSVAPFERLGRFIEAGAPD